MRASVPIGRQPARRITDIDELKAIALRLRRQVITMITATGQGYVQQGLGSADLFAAIYFAELRLDPEDPEWTERDRFILSTAHNSAIFHATLAERGLIPAASLADYCKDGSTLEINPSERLGPMIEGSYGSLGQGLSVGIGMALSARRKGMPSRVYVLLGDGEMQEGQVWEAAMAAGAFRLGNLCQIIDYNEMQVEGHADKVMNMAPVADKWRSFGWAVEEVDGHDFAALLGAFDRARDNAGQPTCIIARTLVGKGSPLLEGLHAHNIRLPADIAEQVMRELGETVS
ncbi:MAG TPA: transketolase [Bauldia sp.]|nr:transketolase [Bauldia sp.]